MYVVQWVQMRIGRKTTVKKDTFSNFALAVRHFIDCDNDPSCERVEIIADKGEGAPARKGADIKTVWDLAEWLNTPEEED